MDLGVLYPVQTMGVFSSYLKIFTPSHRIFGHMHGVLNVDEKN
jgi:hypothetical protein